MSVTKVKSVQGNGTWINDNGVDLGDGTKGFYSFVYEMEDGTVIKANHKQAQPYAEGAEVEYEIRGSNEHGSWGKVGKVKDSQYSGSKTYSKGGDDQRRNSIEAQVALKEAIQTYHVIRAGSLEGTDPIDPITAIKGYADEFYLWLQSKRV